MAIFKIVGIITRTVERNNQRVDVGYPSYRLLRIEGNKPTIYSSQAYENAARRAVARAASLLGFTSLDRIGYVCNDSASNACDNLPAFNAYDDAVDVA